MLSSSSGHALRRGFSTSAVLSRKDAFIVAAARTPIGSFLSSLASVTAPELASVAIKAALERGAVKPNSIQEVFLGQVCQANVGLDPARQAALGAGLDLSVAVTTVNKVCSSGLKAIILAAQQIQAGHQDLAIGGGMENMSRVPFYMPREYFPEFPDGIIEIVDGLVQDCLPDDYDKIHMGNCEEKISKEMGISRKDQDEYAISSYRKTAKAWENGNIGPEVVPVNVKSKKGVTIVDRDEEFTKVNFEKFTERVTVFQKEGTLTVAGSSALNDGAAAVIVASQEAVSAQNLKPLARILAYGDAATHPHDFVIAPTMLFPKILERAGVKQSDVAQWEVNEAFSCVPLAFIKKLGVDASLVNPHGGAVSIGLGHPIGMSGARLITHLVHTLKSGQIGVAAICNEEGASSGMVIQKL